MKKSTILRMCGGAACGITAPILLNSNVPSIVISIAMLLIMAYGEFVGVTDYKEKNNV